MLQFNLKYRIFKSRFNETKIKIINKNYFFFLKVYNRSSWIKLRYILISTCAADWKHDDEGDDNVSALNSPIIFARQIYSRKTVKRNDFKIRTYQI